MVNMHAAFLPIDWNYLGEHVVYTLNKSCSWKYMAKITTPRGHFSKTIIIMYYSTDIMGKGIKFSGQLPMARCMCEVHV